MKVARTLLVTLLVLIIVGGLGYIGYSYFYMQGMDHSGMAQDGNTNSMPHTTSGTNQQGQTTTPNNASQAGIVLSAQAAENQQRLSAALATVNEAIDLITIDPYAQTTVPSNNTISSGTQTTPPSGGIVNVFPSGSGPVNINPPVGSTTVPNTAQSGTTTVAPNTNFVYDQGKLQQLHRGIYTLAQGNMLINQLNDDLASQAAMAEANPPDYQTYLTRYNLALQNKTKLNNAINMLSQASTLINVNPYTSPSGYQFNIQGMQQLHQGVYKLAQGMAMLDQLNNDFTAQLAQANYQVQAFSNQDPHAGMNIGTGWLQSLLGNLSMTTMLSIVLIILLIGLIIGIIGAIANMFRPGPKPENP